MDGTYEEYTRCFICSETWVELTWIWKFPHDA